MNGKCKKASGFIIQCKGEHSIQIINVSLFKNFKLNLKTQQFGNLIGVCFKIDFAWNGIMFKNPFYQGFMV